MEEARRLRQAASFGAGADIYERSRPSYPEAALDWLLPGDAGRTPDPAVLDLGAGTGKLTRQLAGRGLAVTALDPSAEMLDELRRAAPAVPAVQGAAEAIPFPDGSFDLVTVAQAWHWFDEPRAADEVARVLRPGGTLALVWNARDARVDWVGRLGRIIDGGRPAYGFGEPPRLGPRFGAVEQREFGWALRLDEAGLRDLAASRSAFLVSPQPERAAVLADVSALFDEVASASHGDPARRTVELPYRARCFRAHRAA